MSDILDSVFTPKLLMSKYITNKLRYNPKSYSFKDRLIAASTHAAYIHINNVSTESEMVLENLIAEKLPIENIGWRLRKDYVLSNDDEHIKYPRVITGTPCFIKRDNMYFKPENLMRYMDLQYNEYPGFHSKVLNDTNLNVLAVSDYFDALLQLHIALCSENSVVPYLAWQGSDWENLNLTQVMQMTPVMSALENNTTLPILRYWECDYVTFAPVNTGVTNVYDDWSDIHKMGAEDIIAPILHNTYFKCILYGFEVLHALYTIPNSKYVRILEGLLLRNTSNISDILYTNSGGELAFATDEIKDIVFTSNPEERFNKIIMYIITAHIYDSVKIYVASMETVPEWLLETTGFCNEYALWANRVKYLSILYKYCLDNELLDEFKEDRPFEFSEFMSGLDDLASHMEMDVANNLLDLDLGKHYGDEDVENDATFDHKNVRTPTAEALDMIKAHYTDSIYKFDVEDVVDTTASSRYETIASRSYLLNKTLINRIKDIKVYNSGGKCPGKSKGKLDRKALYRYKTNKDIFYDNTYKVKESDLAFGIILDVSGSMHGKGIENGVATMIVLHETLKALSINHSIITHTSDGKYHSHIRRYQAFREDKTYSTLKNYALANIKSYYGNCDSGALFYMEQALKRVKNKDKICLIFSDGEPTECSDSDLKEQVKKMEQEGIKVIGIGINYDNIREYYSEYANGKNLTEMFDIVSEILKQYVLEKED